MENQTFEIVQMFRHEIVYKIMKPKKSLGLLAVILLFVVVNALSFGARFMFEDYGKVLASTVSYLVDPVNPLYNDMGHIVFTSSSGLTAYTADIEVTFSLPMNNLCVAQEGHLTYTVDENLILFACADGIVTTLGTTQNGERYLEMRHSKHLSTRYENLDIAGVSAGQMVESGTQLATAVADETMVFTVLYDGVEVSQVGILDNQVVWQND